MILILGLSFNSKFLKNLNITKKLFFEAFYSFIIIAKMKERSKQNGVNKINQTE